MQKLISVMAFCVLISVSVSAHAAGSACNAPPLPVTGTRIVNVSITSELQNAVANARTGDTIVLANGTYNLTSTLYLNGKNNITIRGNSGCDGVVLLGKGMDNANYGNVSFGIWSNSLNTTIAHLTVRDTYDNALVFNAGAQSPHVYSVKLLNAGSQFIKSNPTNPANGIGVDNGVIEYSWMEYTAGPPATNHGAGVGYTNGISAHAADNWIIRSNVFKNFHTPDSSAYPWNPAVLMWNHSQNTITEKNIFINVDRAIAYGLVDQSTGTDHSGGTIRNNVVYLQPGLMSASRRASSDGAIIVWDSPTTRVYHNTILTNGNVVKSIEFRFTTTGGEAKNNLSDAPIGTRDGATFAQNGNNGNNGNYLLATQAMFVNPTSANLHLLDTTVTRANVIGRGVVLTAVTDDIDGNTRPSGASYDIGADEFISNSPSPGGDTTPPSVPQSLSATAVSSSQINLAWSVSTDNVGVTGYRVYRSGTQIGTTTSTNYAATGLSPSTAYAFTVAAVDAAGNISAQSAAASATTAATPDTTAPTAPTNLTASAASSTQINLAWSASTDNVAVTGYRLERCQGASCTNFAQIATPTATSFNNTSLVANTTYRYRVRATDAAGNLSNYSAIATATTATTAPDTTAPTAPTNLTASAASSTQINLAWSTSTDNVGVTGYRVYRSGTQIATATNTSYAVTGLAPATVYSFTAAAVDAAGNVSAPSNTAATNTFPSPGPGNLPLLHQSDLVYRGAFRVPPGTSDPTSFSYGGTALAYNPAQNSLFLVGHDWYQRTAEVTIPPIVNSASLSALHTAAFLQPFTDTTNGKSSQAGSGTLKVGGQLVYQGRLYGTVYIFYDASGSQVVSHWARPSTSLSSGTASNLSQVGTLGAGFVSGYMTPIPPEWQSAFGGPALTGNCCLSIISRTSFGPAAFVFNPAALGGTTPVPATPLVYYPMSHPTIGDCADNWNPSGGVVFNCTTVIHDIVFPSGSRSVLFFGTQGTGTYCYGTGGASGGECYDPANSSKGQHAYPYAAKVWAYDANDLLAVKNGQKQPWQVTPYATWSLTLPFGSTTIGGAAYDPATGNIYVSQQYGNGPDPVIHVFQTP